MNETSQPPSRLLSAMNQSQSQYSGQLHFLTTTEVIVFSGFEFLDDDTVIMPHLFFGIPGSGALPRWNFDAVNYTLQKDMNTQMIVGMYRGANDELLQLNIAQKSIKFLRDQMDRDFMFLEGHIIDPPVHKKWPFIGLLSGTKKSLTESLMSTMKKVSIISSMMNGTNK